MYRDRTSRALIEKDSTRIEWATEKPECFQTVNLAASWVLMRFFFRRWNSSDFVDTRLCYLPAS